MTPDLVILVGQETRPCEATCARLAACAGWTMTEIGSARLFSKGEGPQRLGQSGVHIIGQLLGRSAEPPAAQTGLGLAIEDTSGAYLVEHCWGRYLAMWQHPRSGAFELLRDPSGALRLYWTLVPGGCLLFSRLETALELGLIQPAINWDSIAHGLRYRHLPTRSTGLAGVLELLPGERLSVGRDGVATAQLWRPLEIAREVERVDDKVRRRLRETIIGTVAELARDAGPSALELSGGLDSSIVAAALHETGADWIGLTGVPPGADGDERDYAARVADHLQAPLRAVPLSPDAIDFLAPPTRLSVRPSGYAMLDVIDRAFGDAAVSAGARTLWSGTGGDNVFCYLRSPVPVLDRFWAGDWRRLGTTARDVAQLTGSHRANVFALALRYAIRDRRRPNRWIKVPDFLGPRTPAMDLHGWLQRPPGTRPGARAHVTFLLRARAIIDALGRADRLDMIFPLLAQPVMEACLRIPSWAWIAGGRDRVVARQAFANDLPTEILQRRSKGRLESLLLPAYARQRSDLIELLRHGRLARNGVIDARLVEAAAARPVVADDPDYFRLLELADAELWVGSIGG